MCDLSLLLPYHVALACCCLSVSLYSSIIITHNTENVFRLQITETIHLNKVVFVCYDEKHVIYIGSLV